MSKRRASAKRGAVTKEVQAEIAAKNLFVERVQFLKDLNKLADRADKMDIALGNGGDVCSLLGSIATDLETVWGIQDQIHQNLKKIPGVQS